MRLGGHCGGCGNGNRACAVARCSLEQERPIEYCYECRRYPCERYRHIDEFDSFITHRRQKADAEKAQKLGIDAYNREQTEKLGMLTKLLAEYNDGRKKALFCTAVNLLPLDDLREILQTLAESTALAALPEKSAHAAALLRQAAAARDIELHLPGRAERRKCASRLPPCRPYPAQATPALRARSENTRPPQKRAHQGKDTEVWQNRFGA